MLTPFCSAAVVPVSMGMASMGVSLGTVLSFLISAPLCNFIVLAMVYAAFGLKVTATYLLITFSAAVLGGWLISKFPWKNEIKRGEELEGGKPLPSCDESTQASKTTACDANISTLNDCGLQPATQEAYSAINMSCESSSAMALESTAPSKIYNALRWRCSKELFPMFYWVR